jgi:mono/diheme cytochrome c family protein
MKDNHPEGSARAPARPLWVVALAAVGFAGVAAVTLALSQPSEAAPAGQPAGTATDLIAQGKDIFRNDTFGDEGFWGGALQLDKAIEGAAHGGVGPGVSPKTALAVGLKVDVEALPHSVRDDLSEGQVDLDDPASTLALLKLNAVVGVKGIFDDAGSLTSVGITCAACHTAVDDSFAPGIGHRLDGWANRDLNVGAIVNLAPPGRLQPVADMLKVDEATVRQVLNSWGPGKFDAELFLDGKAFRPDGTSAATLIPPAFGLAGVNLHTWTGWGSVTQWNAFVANLEMHGQGTYIDTRLDNAEQFPVAAANGLGHVRHDQDLITSKLPALAAYEEVLAAPQPPPGSFDRAGAKRGAQLFAGKAGCASCHVLPLTTEPGWNLHPASDIGIDSFQADRSPTHMYRTSPLHGLWTHTKGGFYHDGRFPTLRDVVDHYDTFQHLGLTPREKRDLVAYLKSL